MSELTLKQLAQQMRGIDLCMLATHTSYGHIAQRPMSNNGEVEYEGTSYFFTWKDSRMVEDIGRDAKVSLGFQGKDGLFVAVEGKATVTEHRPTMAPHWTLDLDQWFKEGLDTPGLCMIRVEAQRIAYWKEGQEGEIKL